MSVTIEELRASVDVKPCPFALPGGDTILNVWKLDEDRGLIFFRVPYMGEDASRWATIPDALEWFESSPLPVAEGGVQ